MSRIRIVCLTCLAAGMGSTAVSYGASTALTLTGGGNHFDYATSVGNTFTVGAASITVTDLGYYNDTGVLVDGASHEVAIYNDATHAQVGTTGIVTGSAATVAAAGPGKFVYVPVTPFTLDANTTYDISASNISGTGVTGGNGFYLVNATGFVIGPDLTYGTSRYANSGTSTVKYPESTFSPNDVGNIAGNFLYSVPEPSVLGVIGLGGAFLAIRRRRVAAF